MSRVAQAILSTIAEAVALLRAGDCVAFPTETVFGLGADAANADAVAKIYAAKNRPSHQALGIMVADLAMAQHVAVFDDRALTLARVMWPGPLSLVLKLREGHGVAKNALAQNDTVVIRLPDHPVALSLLKEFGAPLASTSANPSGQLSTTTALDVARDLSDVPLVLSDATKVIGIESTLLDLSGETPKILRLGAMSAAEIENLIGPVTLPSETASYKLNVSLRMNAVDVKADEALLAFGKTQFIGVEDVGFVKDLPPSRYRNLSTEGDLHQAAANLFTMLHDLVQGGYSKIAVMRIPEEGLGIAINDRLKRAS